MGALTSVGEPTIIFKSVFGNKRIAVVTLTFGDSSSTWPSGGISFTPSQVAMASFEYVAIDSDGQQCYNYDYTNNKIDAFVPASTTGAAYVMVTANGTAPVSGTIRLLCIGYGSF
jgi:hypothetical protein